MGGPMLGIGGCVELFGSLELAAACWRQHREELRVAYDDPPEFERHDAQWSGGEWHGPGAAVSYHVGGFLHHGRLVFRSPAGCGTRAS